MPRFEYVDGNGNAHVVSAPDHEEACTAVWNAEYGRTGIWALADHAVGTVEASDERSRAA